MAPVSQTRARRPERPLGSTRGPGRGGLRAPSGSVRGPSVRPWSRARTADNLRPRVPRARTADNLRPPRPPARTGWTPAVPASPSPRTGAAQPRAGDPGIGGRIRSVRGEMGPLPHDVGPHAADPPEHPRPHPHPPPPQDAATLVPDVRPFPHARAGRPRVPPRRVHPPSVPSGTPTPRPRDPLSPRRRPSRSGCAALRPRAPAPGSGRRAGRAASPAPPARRRALLRTPRRPP